MKQLFVYGTLRCPKILQAILGRVPVSFPAVLDNHATYFVKEATFPGLVTESGSVVEGRVLGELTEQEVVQIDRYEDDFYERTPVMVAFYRQQMEAETYLVPDPQRGILSEVRWDWQTFEKNHLAEYLQRLGIG